MGEKYKMDNQEKLIKIETIQNLLIARATGSNENTSEYETLRFYLLKEADIKIYYQNTF